MKKLYFLFVVFGLLIGTANSTSAFNPKNILLQNPPSSTVSITVYFDIGTTDCPALRNCTFYFHLYAYNTSTQQYTQIALPKLFYYGTYSYSFTGASFDENNYNEIVVSMEVSGSCGYQYQNDYEHVAYSPGTTTYTIPNDVNACH
ncbi:MAG: hypothetical protein WCL00_03595 [Bacteroidota bacterium]